MGFDLLDLIALLRAKYEADAKACVTRLTDHPLRARECYADPKLTQRLLDEAAAESARWTILNGHLVRVH